MSPTPPTTSSFNGCTAGVIRQFSNTCRPAMLGDIGQALSQIGSIRAMSALASATVTPGLSRARLEKLKPSRVRRLRSNAISEITSAAGSMSRNRNPSGMTPITCGRVGVGDQSSSDHRAVAAEPPLPVGVRQDHHRSNPGPAGCGVGLCEEPAQLRLNAQRLQDVVGHKQRARLLRLANAGDRPPTVAVQADVLEDAALLAIREVLRRRHAELVDVEAGRHLLDADELIGIRVRAAA